MQKIVWILVTLLFFSISAGCDFGKEANSSESIVSSQVQVPPASKDNLVTKTAVSLNSNLVQNPEEEVSVEEQGIEFALKYKKYLLSYAYVVADRSGVNIREKPLFSGKILKKAGYLEKINYIETVTGDYIKKYNSSNWYYLYWMEGHTKKFGFVYAPLVKLRTFQFDKMLAEVKKVENQVGNGRISYINNYKNMTGSAPKYKGTDIDSYGNLRDQSAPGYLSKNNLRDFIYIGDGSLVKILSTENGFYKVKLIKSDSTYFVPQKYIPKGRSLSKLTKAIVIDRNNQNEAVFEKAGSKWVIVSYVLATTGVNAQYKLETPLGDFCAIEKRDKFVYLDDETKKVDGYAPYAIRFTGGAYIHGVPVQYKFEGTKRIDPGKIEYSRTIGTVPLSHRCVRNYTSHAEFLYHWAEVGKTVIIVIE